MAARSLRILVADNNDRVRKSLHKTLCDAGYNVTMAINGLEVEKILAENSYDILVVEMVMPKKEGIETIIETKKDYPSIKIIAYSAWDEKVVGPLLKMAKSAGADIVLPAPVKAEEVLAEIEKRAA